MLFFLLFCDVCNLVETAFGKGLVRFQQNPPLQKLLWFNLQERLLLVRTGVVRVYLDYQADLALLAREAAMEIAGSGVGKASNDDISSFVMDIDGLDFDELNLFFPQFNYLDLPLKQSRFVSNWPDLPGKHPPAGEARQIGPPGN